MDINLNVNVKFEETPALINCFSAFSTALQATVGALAGATTTSLTATEATLEIKPDESAPVTITPAPASATPTPAPSPVPTAPVHQYTLEEIQAACGPLMDAGKMDQLAAILQKFGVASLPEIPKEQYGAIAVELRQLGARI